MTYYLVQGESRYYNASYEWCVAVYADGVTADQHAAMANAWLVDHGMSYLTVHYPAFHPPARYHDSWPALWATMPYDAALGRYCQEAGASYAVVPVPYTMHVDQYQEKLASGFILRESR